jgi:lysophospholipase L1-like esterase
MQAILCFGDSVTWGRGETPNTGWVGRLKQKVESSGRYRAVYNLGVCGDTSTDLLRRFSTECDARVRVNRREDRFLILIAIGLNDSCWRGGPKSGDVFATPKQFNSNVLKIIRLAKKYPAKVALIGVTSVDESRTVPYENTTFRNARIILFNDVLKQCAASEKLPFLDIYGAMSKAKRASMLDDGLHPNKKGYAFLFAQIDGFIRVNDLFPEPD